MSLLMDALKRAETAKQEAARAQFGIAPGTGPEAALSLEPLPGETGSPASNPLPDLANYIDAVDADLASNALPKTPPPAASHAPGAASPAPANEQSNRQAVRNAFAAKQAPTANGP